jgi:hypothetical protein
MSGGGGGRNGDGMAKDPCTHMEGVVEQYKMYKSTIFINFISRSKKLNYKSCMTTRHIMFLAILHQGVKRAIFMRVKELRLHRNKFAHLIMPDEFKGTVFRKNWAGDNIMAQEEQLTGLTF